MLRKYSPVLLVILFGILCVILLHCCGCATEFVSPKVAPRIQTSQPVDLSEEFSFLKAHLQVMAKGIESNRTVSYQCDVWDGRLRTGLIFVLAIVAGIALYKVVPGKGIPVNENRIFAPKGENT